MSRKSLGLDETVARYLLDHVPESEVQRRLRAETAQLAQANMQIAPEQGRFMAVLARLLNVRRAVEIGTFTGYSALCIAEAVGEAGRLICCDVSREWTDIARRYWGEAGVAERIDLRLGPALDTLAPLALQAPGQFDFVFVDADKANYDRYYELSLTLVRSGGAILIDNALWSGKVAAAAEVDDETRAIRALNAKIAQDSRVSASLVPIADGLWIAMKR